MIRNIWPPRLLLWGLTAILLAGLTLAACGDATEPASEQSAVPAQSEATSEVEAVVQDEPATATVPAAVEEEAQEAVATAMEPTSAATAASQVEEAAIAAAECETVDIPDNIRIAAATETEWSKGPADAPVTLIEYGDFQ